jgi:hypothetical protein
MHTRIGQADDRNRNLTGVAQASGAHPLQVDVHLAEQVVVGLSNAVLRYDALQSDPLLLHADLSFLYPLVGCNWDSRSRHRQTLNRCDNGS